MADRDDDLPPTPPLIHVVHDAPTPQTAPLKPPAIVLAKPLAGQKRKRSPSVVSHLTSFPQKQHPYLSGNFAPIHQTLPLTPCSYTGTIPPELAGGEYVRNGSNPVSNEDLGRDAHWFDGDGMLAGVSFTRNEKGGITPEFVNQFVLTDLYLSATNSPSLKVPILPSIATLVNPLASFLWVTIRIFRTLLLVLLSHLPGSKFPIKKISVANTNVVYHDGRALATCESGPPMRILLPGLETVGWYNGSTAENEPVQKKVEEKTEEDKTFGSDSALLGFMREWTTAHPKVDPVTQEMLMFHACFAPPYVQYSVVPAESSPSSAVITPRPRRIINAAVPGIGSAKMMHDFGVSRHHTVIMDLPLSLDPLNQLRGKPPVAYDSSAPARFGVFPRQHPENVRWFETDACCIFHTANTWDEFAPARRGARTNKVAAINMLACRLTSVTLVFAAGNIAAPVEKRKKRARAASALTATPYEPPKRMPFFAKYNPALSSPAAEITAEDSENAALLPLEPAYRPDRDDWDEAEEEQCRLYFYSFDLASGDIAQQFALASLPFEFPSVRPDREMREARYVYGCSTTATSFGAALGKATKIDLLVKMDVQTLIARGRRMNERNGIVDTRPLQDILMSKDEKDPIRVFQMPPGWCAGEMRFVPAASPSPSFPAEADDEDAGYLLFYAFDESQLRADGSVPDDADPVARARSELWILNAKDMRTIEARIRLPQRVPYGLHGSWFDETMVRGQRDVVGVRNAGRVLGEAERMQMQGEKGVWGVVREMLEGALG